MSATRSRMSAPPGSIRRTRPSRDRTAGRPRRTDTVVEEDADDEDTNERDPTTSTPQYRTRQDLRESVSASHPHRRTRSFTHTALATYQNVNDTPAGKKARLRRSLAGPVVQEMTVETRAVIVSEVAEDCIIKLLRADLNGHHLQASREQDWQAAYQALQGESPPVWQV